MKTIGERLRWAIDMRGTNPSQVSKTKAVKVSRQAIYQIINGDTENPKLETLFSLADHLMISPRWLATGKGPIEDEWVNFGREIGNETQMKIIELFEQNREAVRSAVLPTTTPQRKLFKSKGKDHLQEGKKRGA